MGIGSAVDHIACDVGKEAGQRAEQDTDCKSKIQIAGCLVRLYHGGSGDDYNMMAAKEVVAHGCESQAECGHTENQLG